MSSSEDALALKVALHLRALEGTGDAWNIEVLEVRAGYARISMVVRRDMLNGHGTCHGGLIFSLADTAFAYACNSRNVSTVAQQASIVFLAPATEGDLLVAEAKEEGLSGKSGVYAVHVRMNDGKLIASFQGLSRAGSGAVLPVN